MKNFVISLASATDRRSHIISEFQKQGIGFSFFDAITPETMAQAVEDLGVDISKTELRKCEIACLLSHAVLWKKAVDENLPYIAIFEDDIHLGRKSTSFLTSDKWIPAECKIVKLEAFYPKIIVALNYKPLINSKRKLALLKAKHMGCGGYILSNESARNLLALLKQYEVLIPVDHIVFNDYLQSNPQDIFQMLPAICIQDHRLTKSHDKFPSFLEQERNLRKGEDKTKVKLSLLDKAKREFLRLGTQTVKIVKELAVLLQGERVVRIQGERVVRIKFK